jgi:S-ribosylhomocysteine lyase
MLIDEMAQHSIEHLLAVELRKELKDDEEVVYFGNMGCKTGQYCVTRGIGKDRFKTLLVDAISRAILAKEVPYADEICCGTFDMHDLELAKKYLADYLKVLEGVNGYKYPV